MTHFDNATLALRRRPDIAARLELPPDSAYFGNLPIGETWSLGPVILTRDSDILTTSNHAAIKDRLEKQRDLQGRWEIVVYSHWACGWVEHLAYRVIMGNGKPDEKMIGFMDDLKRQLEEYPVLDEDDFGVRELEDACHWCEEATRRYVRGLDDEIKLPDDIGYRVCEWLEESDLGYSTDEDHNYPKPEQVKAALIGLGCLKGETHEP